MLKIDNAQSLECSDGPSTGRPRGSLRVINAGAPFVRHGRNRHEIKLRVVGHPRHISMSYVERQNLTLRMQQRRFTRLARLTNAFSKKLENHEAAVALYLAHFNVCRVHETLRIMPAMQLGVADHIRSMRVMMRPSRPG
jgi:hypothetical protein